MYKKIDLILCTLYIKDDKVYILRIICLHKKKVILLMNSFIYTLRSTNIIKNPSSKKCILFLLRHSNSNKNYDSFNIILSLYFQNNFKSRNYYKSLCFTECLLFAKTENHILNTLYLRYNLYNHFL
jgi:hypothetical protein